MTKIVAILPLCLLQACTANLVNVTPDKIGPAAITAFGQKAPMAQTRPVDDPDPKPLPQARMSGVSRPALNMLVVTIPADQQDTTFRANQIDATAWLSLYATNRDNIIIILLTPPPKPTLPTRLRR